MKINSKGMLSIFVMTILALSFALPFASVSALTIVNIDLTPPEDSQVGDLVTVSGAAGEVTSGATIRGFWDIAIGEGAILLNTTTGKPDGSYSFEITIPDCVNGTHYIWVEDVATAERANSIGINITRKVKLKPSWGLAGDEFTVSGTGFSEDNNITLVFWNATGGSGDVNYTKTFTETPITDEYGSFSVELDVPSVLAGKQNYGTFYVNASDDVSVINATSTYIVGVSITITPDKGPEGTVIELIGTGFTANATLSVGNLTWDDTYSIPIVDDTITIDPNGEFSGYIVVPSWTEGTYEVNVSDKNVWANETFTIDGVATIEVSPTYGSPGSTITLNGYNFTQIAGTEITLSLNDAEETGLGYVDTDADGTFETTCVSPAITFGTYDVWANDTTYGVNASDTFEVGLIGMIINPTSGSAGTEVALTGIGFKTGTYNLTFGDILYEDYGDGVTSGEAISDIFYVPNVEPGVYEVVVEDEAENELTTHYTVTESTTASIEPAVAPNLYNVSISGNNFADVLDGDLEFVLCNSTDDWLMDVDTHFTAGDSTTVTDDDGNFTGHWHVLDEDTLSLGDYTVNITDSKDLRVQLNFSVVTARVEVTPRKALFDRGHTITFDISNDFALPDSYIEIYCPDDTLYWITDDFTTVNPNLWVLVEGLYTVPFYYQTAGGNPMMFLYDAPLGVWTWTFYDKTNNELGSGSFTVAIDKPTIPPVAYIDKPSITFYESEIIEFRGHGTDPDGRITGYMWETDDRIMSLQDSFTTSFDESGTHAVLFSVMDQDGIWSEPVTLSLEIKSYFFKINGIYVQTEHVAVATGAGATTTIIAISRSPTQTLEKIQKIRNKKELERQKKEERRNKKIKGKPLITWSIEAPDFIYKRKSEVSIKLYNVGFAKAKNITIDLYSTYGLKLEKTHINIPELDVQKKDEATISFQLMPFARNGLFKIVARINTWTLLEERKVHFITVLKTGLLMPHPNCNQDNIIEWLDESKYHWSSFSNPENYLNLMEYDLILITNSELSKKSINNLKIYTMMGNKIVVNDRVRKREPELMDLLGYREIDKEEIKVETSYVQFDTGDYPLLKGTNIDSLKKETEFLTLSQLKIGTGKVISTANYLKNDVKLSLPLITVNKIQDGHVIHINYVANGDQNGVHSNTKNIINYVLDSLYLEKKVPTKGRL